MSLIDPDTAWESLGRSDPYFGVLAYPRFRAASQTGPERQEFFASGERHVARCFELLDRPDQPFRPRRALDYGCGVGRITLPLAARCDAVVGVDISSSMLAEAERNRTEAGLENVTFVPAEDFLGGDGERYDLIHSHIVLQHVQPRRGEAILQVLVQRLEEGGVGVVHLTYASGRPFLRRVGLRLRSRIGALHFVLNLLQRKPARTPLMQMNTYDLNRVFRLLHASGCHDVQLRFTDHEGFYGVVILFRKTEIASF